MGYLYNEIVECRHKKMLRYLFAGLIFLLLLDTLGLIMITFRGYTQMLLLAGLTAFLIMVIPAYLVWLKTNVRYKYSIIDNELIIEKLRGGKRKVLININLKAIERLEKIDEKLKNDNKLLQWKKYSYMEKKSRGYLCTYNTAGEISGFCFEPSQKLLEKIYNAIGEKFVA